MKRRLLLLGSLLAPAAARAQPGVNQPQPRLRTEDLVIVGRDGARHVFRTEMALGPNEQTVGMMFRTGMAPDDGMLFDWGAPRESSMWMRNTLIPLDMIFIAADGRIHRIHERAVPQSLATIDSRGPVRATLELQGGTAERLNLRVGDRVIHPIFGTN
ncbi:DUF192 domain-containing protein [Roseococcus sp. SYP-B2431]|uniref:DUF192 domain-containing protein n=1 Tax=Roseococcus sp. SYP-B2431 TaxID=2496640 RepID=UPI00103B5CFB|nr:DUF192 domain-containing protein [Roseococcus sp. SYP-B2431]TCH99616.1 DUF192 domain-containing protein [Roseococcus sp. SYP-B2431]